MKWILLVFSLFLFSCVFAIPIDYSSGTEGDNAIVSKSNIYVYVDVPGTNETNITFSLFNSTGEVNFDTYTDYTRSVKWSNLPAGTYTYNVTIDNLGDLNSTVTRTITLFPAELSLDLETNYLSIGDVFFVDVMIDNSLDLFSFEFDLIYDDSVLEAINPLIQEGTFLNSSNDTLCLGGVSSLGVIDDYACILYILSGNRVGVNGSGFLARAFFQAIDEGDAYINFSEIILQDSTSPINNVMMYSTINFDFSIQGSLNTPIQITPRADYLFYNGTEVNFNCGSSNADNLTLWTDISGSWVETDTDIGNNLNYDVVIDNFGVYSWACVARDYDEIIWTESNYSFDVLDKTVLANITIGNDWENGTTELDSLSNDELLNISNVSFINAYGKIRFLEKLRLLGDFDLVDKIIIENRRIFVNSDLISEFNKSAELKFFNLNLNDPRILKDGVACSNPVCNITSYSGGELVFLVSSFSEYVVEETLTCSDGIQNQGETGVDCGGPCSDCSTSSSPSSTSSTSSSSSTSSLPNLDLGMTGDAINDVESCFENFVCSNWGDCVNGTRLRECHDVNNCSDDRTEIKNCFEDIQSYFWNYAMFFLLLFFAILILYFKLKSYYELKELEISLVSS